MNAEREPRFLVIGNVMRETVTREDGRSRRQLGGVGGIMARELGRAGADVTLLAPVIDGQQEEMRDLLEDHGVKPMLLTSFPPHTCRAEATIQVRGGEPVATRGYFAKPPSMGEEIRTCRDQFDFALAALCIEPDDLSLLARLGGNLVVNATTPELAPRLGRMRGITAATMNQREQGAMADDRPGPAAAFPCSRTEGQQTSTLITAAPPR